MEMPISRFCFRVCYVLLGLTVLAGCTTNFSQGAKSPLKSFNTAAEYLKSAENAPPIQTLIYRLRAADLYIRAQAMQEAQKVLRETRAENIDVTVHKDILASRLALIQKDYSKARSKLKSALNTLNQYLGFNTRANYTNDKVKIGLLLPSKGPHADAAKIIREGFLAAYYQTLEHKPTDPTVKFYDTGDGHKVREAYQQALADQVTFIVGPLTKPEVEAMANTRLQIPVLALNTIPEDNTTQNLLYQFGLLPEDEVTAVGQLALRQGHKNALILAPDNDWGHRLASTFKHFWQSNRGNVADTGYFKSNHDLDEKIQGLLRVNGGNRRQDADMIFIAASPEIARHIKPLLSLYSANNLPIYATSSVYSGANLSKYEQDMNGIRFCDMPWILQPSSHLQDENQTLERLSKQGQQAPRFYALGMDAYQLALQLGRSNHLPSYGISGYTGNLHLNGYQRIERGLVCAKFEQGVPVPD